MKTILITGINGSSGSALYKFLNSSLRECQILGTDIRTNNDQNIIFCDLSSEEETYTLISNTKPDQIYHLAGTFSNVFDVDLTANVKSTRNLYEAIYKIQPNCRILLIGSAAEYGNSVTSQCPVSENTPLCPTTFYGITKLFQHELMKFYYNTYKIDSVMARTFNILDKNLSPRLFIGSIYQQIAKLKAGEISHIKTGNLSSYRDYLSIDLVVKYYTMIMDKGKPGEVYNVASGKPIMMRELLENILIQENIDSAVLVEDKTNASKTSTIDSIYANINKLKSLFS